MITGQSQVIKEVGGLDGNFEATASSTAVGNKSVNDVTLQVRINTRLTVRSLLVSLQLVLWEETVAVWAADEARSALGIISIGA